MTRDGAEVVKFGTVLLSLREQEIKIAICARLLLCSWFCVNLPLICILLFPNSVPALKKWEKKATRTEKNIFHGKSRQL